MAEEGQGAALLDTFKKLLLDTGTSEETRPKVLDEVTLDGIVKHIQKLAASDNGEPQTIWKYIYHLLY